MAYLQQQQQQQQPPPSQAHTDAGPGQAAAQGEVMTSAYEVHQINEVDGKHHLVDIHVDTTEGTEEIDPGAQTSSHQRQQKHQQAPSTQHGPNTTASEGAAGDDSRQDTSSADLHSGSLVDGAAGIKTPNSYKYPLLKRYYEFGPWVGRNRKAICLGCHLQTSSSQPDRLLKHLNRCVALTETDKVAVQDLMNERTANKRKKPVHLKLKRGRNADGADNNNDNDSEYYGEELNAESADDLALSNTISLPAGGLKKLRRDHPDRNSQIDEALTRFIMMCRIPLKAIHSPEFVELCRVLNPDYHIPSRETITNVLIPGLLNII